MVDFPNWQGMQIEVSDFGPIAEAKVDLRPLTVFIGPSNTGKSYLAILIYALHRFFSGASHDAGMWNLAPRRRFPGPFLFGDHPQFGMEPEQGIGIVTEWLQSLRTNPIENGQLRELPHQIATAVHPRLLPGEYWDTKIPEELARCFGTTNAHWLIRHGAEADATFTLNILDGEPGHANSALRYEFSLGHTGFSSTGSMQPSTPLHVDKADAEYLAQSFLLIQSLREGLPSGQALLPQWTIDELADKVGSRVVSPWSKPAHYLPADRTGVMHAHQVVVASMHSALTATGLRPNAALPSLSGVLSDFLLQLLNLGNTEAEMQTVGAQDLGTNIEERMLIGSIQTGRSSTNYPIFSYLPVGWDDALPLMNSSSMVSELAPVVLYLRHVVEAGEVLIIEEPESNLHPAMQVELIRQLARVVNAGVRVVLTTHSEWVLEQLANLVRLSEVDPEKRTGNLGAEYALDKSDVGVWLFEKENGLDGSYVKELPLDLDEGGFVSGYDQVARLTYNEWATISNMLAGRNRFESVE